MRPSPAERCPNCGTPVDSVGVKVYLSPALARDLRQMAAIVRRERGLKTDGDAILQATRELARRLHQGASS